MDPDLSEFGEITRPYSSRCWFAKLTPEQQEKVTAAHEVGHSNERISAVVTKWGTRIGAKTVGTHFRKGCSCD